ncbi:MAG TPA: hypothetical protein VLN48_19100 [Bryobacteraceae bacterium]|nr:hypothetical protein [Bryobacteraceae bacterium]
MDLFSQVIGITEVVLLLVLLFLLIRGPFRRYFLIFAYSLAQALQTVVDGVILRRFGQSSIEYKTVFWTDAIIVDLLLILVVIALTNQAMEGNPLRRNMTRVLIVLSVVIAVLPFVVLRRPLFLTRWFNGTDQILNFGAAIMNLVLWTALLGSKKRDAQLLTVTAGLGARVAATALLLGLRHFTEGGGLAREIADTAARLTIVAGTLIWCWAFRPSTRRSPPSPETVRTPAPT